jgi:hypothetical protein
MPGGKQDDPPADFLAVAEKMTTSQLERSLGWMSIEAAKGHPLARDMLRWTQDIIEQRAATENQPVIGSDGHQYTQRQYREKQQRDDFQAGIGALTNNVASALTFWLSGDAHLSGLVGGIFGAAGGTAKGRNENRQMSQPDPAPLTPPRAGEPPREVSPGSDSPAPSEQAPMNQPSAPGPDAGDRSSAAAPGPGGGGAGSITYADLKAAAEAVFGLPEYVVAAAQALTREGVPANEATMTFLQAFAEAAPPGTGTLAYGAEGLAGVEAPFGTEAEGTADDAAPGSATSDSDDGGDVPAGDEPPLVTAEGSVDGAAPVDAGGMSYLQPQTALDGTTAFDPGTSSSEPAASGEDTPAPDTGLPYAPPQGATDDNTDSNAGMSYLESEPAGEDSDPGMSYLESEPTGEDTTAPDPGMSYLESEPTGEDTTASDPGMSYLESEPAEDDGSGDTDQTEGSSEASGEGYDGGGEGAVVVNR